MSNNRRCDICDCDLSRQEAYYTKRKFKIFQWGRQRFRLEGQTGEVSFNQTVDICDACFDEFKGWVTNNLRIGE